MRWRKLYVAAAVLCIGLVSLSAQDRRGSGRTRQLPANWAKLGLSAEQKTKVYNIQTDYKAKIDALAKQIDDLKKKEKSELEAVLTDGQKTRLREILLEKAPAEKPTTKSDKKKDK